MAKNVTIKNLNLLGQRRVDKSFTPKPVIDNEHKTTEYGSGGSRDSSSTAHTTAEPSQGSFNLASMMQALRQQQVDREADRKEIDSLKEELKEKTEALDHRILCASNVLEKQVETATTALGKKVEDAVVTSQHQTAQGFVEVLQWVLDAHLENIATVATLKELTEGADNTLVRNQLFHEALKKGAEVATAVDLPTLADSWNELADQVGIVGDDTSTD